VDYGTRIKVKDRKGTVKEPVTKELLPPGTKKYMIEWDDNKTNAQILVGRNKIKYSIITVESDAESDDEESIDAESETVSDAASVTSAASISETPLMPGDGCVANSVTRIGVFKKFAAPSKTNGDNAAAKAALNAQIKPVFDNLSKHDPTIKESEVGVPDKIWHKDCVKRAVTENGYHFFRLEIDPTNPNQADLRKEFKKGTLLVEGLLNRKFLKHGRSPTLESNWVNRYPETPSRTRTTRTTRAGT